MESPEIAALMARLDYWECWAYVALGAVFFGVLFETVPEFIDFPRTEQGERRARRLGGLLLLGLAGEGLMMQKTLSLSSIVIARLQHDNATLLTRVRPRFLNGQKFVARLRGKQPARAELLYVPYDEEAYGFAMQIRASLRSGRMERVEPEARARRRRQS
jgi:hypothetical protein